MQIQILDEQIACLRSHAPHKKIDIEVCGDHNNHPFAPEKIELMEYLRDRFVEIISTDLAPIGGWSRTGDHTIWEIRLQMIHDLKLLPDGRPSGLNN